jgi:hypothetical protein
MQCAECERLAAQREILAARLAKTLVVLSASVISGIAGDFLRNRKAADEAKADLDRATKELDRHQASHQ